MVDTVTIEAESPPVSAVSWPAVIAGEILPVIGGYGD
jgi:hypothetical protein